MKHYIQTAKTYVTIHKKQFIIGTSVAAAIFLISLIAVITSNNKPKYTYQPINACDLFTPSKAQDLLGDRVIGVDTKKPAITGNVAISKCSYTDANPDASNMIVAAIAVRSAVNDQGIAQNKADFATARSNNRTEPVQDLGDSAYFNIVNNQLNVLDGGRWIILNYGVGSAPETNTVEQTIKLAQKVLLEPQKLPSF